MSLANGIVMSGMSRWRGERCAGFIGMERRHDGFSKAFTTRSGRASHVYIELHAASAFSFLQGASLPEALVERAAALGYPALALLDRDGVYGAPRFHKAALAAGIRPIIGAELTVSNSEFVLPVLCESADGYRNLCQLITRMKMRAPK